MKDKSASHSKAWLSTLVYVLCAILFYGAINYGYPVYVDFLVNSVSTIKYVGNGADTYGFWACGAIAISCYLLDLITIKRLQLRTSCIAVLLLADLIILFGISLLSIIDDNSLYHQSGLTNARSLYHFSTAFFFILVKNGIFELFKRWTINKNNDTVKV